MDLRVKYCIIGAGPAGLCFAGSQRSTLIVDMGKSIENRSHDNAYDIPCGAGGAGLYSDGKFSYFPAGTNVWRLPYHLIEKAYLDLIDDMPSDLPPLPTTDEIRDYFFKLSDYWKLKKYPTEYLNLDQRKTLIHKLVNKVIMQQKNDQGAIWMQHQVTSIIPIEDDSSNNYRLIIHDLQSDKIRNVLCETLIMAGGRFFPLQMPKLLKNMPMIFRRYEFGFRIESSAKNAAMMGDAEFRDVLDPKFRYLHEFGKIEFRTFCWCRQGEAICSEIAGITSYSGRSDCAVTNKSNFGFLVRITDPTAINHTEDFQKIANTQPFDLNLIEVLKDKDNHLLSSKYGNYIGELLQIALESITEKFPDLCSAETHLLGPSIEGVGWYPNIDHNLQVVDPLTNEKKEIFCLGDNSGTFRGIIPCMISGYYLAHALKMREQKLIFVTGNINKAMETEQILGPLIIKNLDLSEIQGEPIDIVKDKCRQAAMITNSAVLVEDTSLSFDALNELPGPYIKDFFEKIGNTNLAAMLHNYSSNHAAVARCIFAYSAGAGDECLLFIGETKGTIVAPRGDTNFGWDAIFQPDGYDLTYAEIDPAAKNKISHRYQALKLVQEFLSNQIL